MIHEAVLYSFCEITQLSTQGNLGIMKLRKDLVQLSFSTRILKFSSLRNKTRFHPRF
jgi:hypothetical protein